MIAVCIDCYIGNLNTAAEYTSNTVSNTNHVCSISYAVD